MTSKLNLTDVLGLKTLNKLTVLVNFFYMFQAFISIISQVTEFHLF